jgi:hypothetical protein
VAEPPNDTVRDPPESDAQPFAIPEALRRRLMPWIDIDEVGAPGLWRWLDTVLPLLPIPGGGPAGSEVSPGKQRLQELARDLVDCAGDRARLTIACEQYFSDNRALSLRVKALEAAVRSFERTGARHAVDEDAGVAAVAERYLPRR